MRLPLARASLFDAACEDDFTLLEDHGEYLVSAGNRVGTYKEFVQVLFNGDDGCLFDDLVTGNVPAKFLILMEALSMRWGGELRAEIVQEKGG